MEQVPGKDHFVQAIMLLQDRYEDLTSLHDEFSYCW